MSIKLTREDFVRKSIEVHGELYDYSKSVYTRALDKLVIGCKVHGSEFLQTPAKHMSGQGCPKCKTDKLRNCFVSNKDIFAERAKAAHGDLYNYDEVEYFNSSTKVKIYCNTHKEYFDKTPQHHLDGQGCPTCSRENQTIASTRPLTDTISIAGEIHGDRYDYSKVELVDCKSKVTVICRNPKHGEFQVTMDNHIGNGSGCPKCSHIISNSQTRLFEYIQGLYPDAISNKKLKDNTELDIFIPSKGVGFEYNGLYWHGEAYKSPGYHLKKTLQAESEGIRLVHIWEDEWLKYKPKVQNLVDTVLGLSSLKFNARQSVVKTIEWKQCSAFLEEHHLQGSCASTSMCLGLFIKDDLISVMCFTTGTVTDNDVELIRFCSKGNVRGGFSKMLKHFISTTSFDSIISFSDKRWSQGKVYEHNGFEKRGLTPPAYWWCKGIDRFHRRGFQHKYLATKLKVYNPEISESENCKANGYFKLWDCGKDKWVLKLK